MSRKNRFKWLFVYVVFLPGLLQAQSFLYKANLDPVAGDGFYSVGVTPVLSAMVKTDFSDLRIKDGSANEVPYLMESAIPQLMENRYKAMTLHRNFVDDSGNNVIIIDNPSRDHIAGFRMLFQNAAVSRSIDLSGSNDTSRWFSIVENVGLERRFIQDSDSFSEQIAFPLSSYLYFRLVVRNGKNNPLKPLGVERSIGIVKSAMPVLAANPALVFDSKDSNKTTTLSIHNPLRFHLNLVTLRVKSPRFFRRTAVCYSGGRQVGDFILSSDSVLHLALPLLNDSLITVRIDNEDNPPLQFSDVETLQFTEKLITYLEKGKTYLLEMTSEQATAPRYDLIHFKDSIPATMPVLGFAKITSVKSPPAVVADDSNGWIWPCLFFVILVLGLSVYQLTRDVAKKKNG